MTSLFIAKLFNLGLLKVQGSRAKELLQGQLTCDMNEVTDTTTHLGAHCNRAGRIISLFRIFYRPPDYFLLMPRDMIPIALNALKKYAVFFKVDLLDWSNDVICIGYSGDLKDAGYSNICWHGSFRIILGNQNLCEKIQQTYQEISIDEWKYHDIINLIPQIYPETSEKFLPHEINLPSLHGVSFNKGCYTGQEIIARMHYRGKLKTHLFRASIKSHRVPLFGADIYDNVANPAGIIVDFCKTGYNNYEVLYIGQKTLDPSEIRL